MVSPCSSERVARSLLLHAMGNLGPVYCRLSSLPCTLPAGSRVAENRDVKSNLCLPLHCQTAQDALDAL